MNDLGGQCSTLHAHNVELAYKLPSDAGSVLGIGQTDASGWQRLFWQLQAACVTRKRLFLLARSTCLVKENQNGDAVYSIAARSVQTPGRNTGSIE